MTPQEFQQIYPLLESWMSSTLERFSSEAKPVASYSYRRLPEYFGESLLEKAKVVAVDQIPMPPLSKIGLERFSDFEKGDFAGITYLNTFFVKRFQVNESLFFHELIHVIQWETLGPERFLAMYADGLERFGYAGSPLEAMAYKAQAMFDAGNVFYARQFVAEQLGLV